MGQTAAPWTLPYPEQTDPADVPVDMKELADRLNVVLAGLDARLAGVEASAGSVALLGDVKLAAVAPSMDFQNIPQTYAQLMLFVVARCDAAQTAVNLILQLNGTATNHDWQRVSGVGAVANAAEGLNVNGVAIASCPGAQANANMFASVDVRLPDYTGTTHQQAVIATFFRKITVASGDMMGGVYGGNIRNNAAVNRVTVLPGAGSFVVGSRATLYGMRGSA